MGYWNARNTHTHTTRTHTHTHNTHTHTRTHTHTHHTGPVSLLRFCAHALTTPVLLVCAIGRVLGSGGLALLQQLVEGLQGAWEAVGAVFGAVGGQLQLLASFLGTLVQAAAPWGKVVRGWG